MGHVLDVEHFLAHWRAYDLAVIKDRRAARPVDNPILEASGYRATRRDLPKSLRSQMLCGSIDAGERRLAVDPDGLGAAADDPGVEAGRGQGGWADGGRPRLLVVGGPT